jgi:uncharacterized membrane protein
MMMRRTPMVSRQRGRTALVVLSVVFIGALALLFIYFSYVNSKEEESVRQPLDLDAASPRSRESEAKAQALEERRQNFERQAEELQQKRMQLWNERQARQRRLGQEREVQKKE